MRDVLMDYYLEELRKSLGDIHGAVDENVLLAPFKEKRYGQFITCIRNSVDLSLAMRIEYLKDGSLLDPPLWVGSGLEPAGAETESRKRKLHLFVRRVFLEMAPFEVVVLTFARALTAVVLYERRRDLYKDPGAIDVAAMFLGYAEFYRKGKEHVAKKAGDEASYAELMEFLGGGKASQQSLNVVAVDNSLSSDEIDYVGKRLHSDAGPRN